MSKNTKNFILIGNGGHSKVIQDIIVANKIPIYAILDDTTSSRYVKNNIIFDKLSFIREIDKQKYEFFIGIGDNAVRKKIVETVGIPNGNYATLIHPSAIISDSAMIGNGTVIMPNVVINSKTAIGDHCIINTGCIVEHDNVISDYVHISPNATLTGNVKVYEGAHVGASATIIPGKQIGNWSKVGAGAVVTKNLQSNITAVGVPAKEI